MQTGFPGAQLGSFHLAYFSLIVLVALAELIIVGWLAARRKEQDAGIGLDTIISAFVASLLIGRLIYVLLPPPSVAMYTSRDWFLAHWSDLLVGPLALWSGGLDPAGLWLGALMGAGLAVWRRRADGWLWADILTPGALLFLVIAPWANVVNQQLLGPPTTLPWGVAIDHRVPPLDDLARFPMETRFHPTPAYVAIAAAVVLILALTVFGRLSRFTAPGNRFLFSALLLLPTIFVAEFLRMDVSALALGLTALQWVSLILWLAALAIVIQRMRAIRRGDAQKAA